jgi:hypothetical protein
LNRSNKRVLTEFRKKKAPRWARLAQVSVAALIVGRPSCPRARASLAYLGEITPIICILPAGAVASARQRPDGADDRPEQERPAEKVDVLASALRHIFDSRATSLLRY